MEQSPTPSMEQLLRDLRSSDYAIKQQAIRDLTQIEVSTPLIVATLIIVQRTGGSVQIKKAAQQALESPVHLKVLQHVEQAKQDALTNTYAPPENEPERTIYEYLYLGAGGVHPSASPTQTQHMQGTVASQAAWKGSNMDSIFGANIEQLLQELNSSDYLTRLEAIQQLEKLTSSNYEIVSTLITSMGIVDSQPIVKAIRTCLSLSAHQKIIQEFSSAAIDADTGAYTPPTSAPERIIYDYVHSSRLNEIKANPVPSSVLMVNTKTYCPQCDMDRGAAVQCPICNTRLIEYGSKPSIQRIQVQQPPTLGMLACRECGFGNIPDRRVCQNCRAPLYSTSESSQTSTAHSAILPSASITSPPTTSLSFDERRKILDNEVSRYIVAGYVLISRTENTAQLVSESSPNGCILIGLFLLGIIPGLIYMAVSKRTESLYIEVDEFGRLKHTSVTK